MLLKKTRQLGWKKVDQNETFNTYTKLYITERKYEVAKSTLRSEQAKVNNLNKLLGKRKINEIKHSDIKQLIAKMHRRFCNKTINAHLTILRAVFFRATHDGIITLNPLAGIHNLTVTRPQPDPLTRNELTRLRNTQAYCRSGKNLALLGSLTGLRISELIALAWEDINFQKKELYVRRARVLREYKVPKTRRSVRTVQINDIALEILHEQFHITSKRKPRCVRVLQIDNKQKIKTHLTFVFINTKTQQPFLDAKQYCKTFFTQFLKAANVRCRGASQLRHTFASQCLTAGISKEWIALQLGHTSTMMIDQHYGRWLPDDAPDHAKMLSLQFGSVFGREARENEEKTQYSNQPAVIMKLLSKLQQHPDLIKLLEAVEFHDDIYNNKHHKNYDHRTI